MQTTNNANFSKFTALYKLFYIYSAVNTDPFVALVALNSLLSWSDDLETSVANIASLKKLYLRHTRVTLSILSLFLAACFTYIPLTSGTWGVPNVQSLGLFFTSRMLVPVCWSRQ